ncbi:MAG TPA: decaprenyl-phosphate phosphoribosyltransferase [Vicinamibacterales bacterium]|jgi:4-hydroxybenzoate polyprenyltransferase|nr:decaprenyl-phosphate phosphoribosyltransferase [Vicinamibacterales bacterium]
MKAPSTPGLLLVSLRPEQWTKNLLVLAGIVFGGRLLEPSADTLALVAFAVFCALSGAVYLFNDIADREADRRHPLKRERPIASGQLSVSAAAAAGGILGVAGVGAAFAVGTTFGIVAATYLASLLLYSVALKHVVIVDVLMIAGGFVLRAVGGAVAVDVPIGHWLLVCTTLLALFLALSKRRHELVVLADGATDHRRILEEYSPYLLDQMIGVVTSSTLIAYTVYATSPDTAARLGTGKLGLTIPFVLYGIFRYLYLVHQKRGGGSPAAMLLTDRPLLGCVALWAASVIALMYTPLGK